MTDTDPWVVLHEHERRLRAMIRRMCPADLQDDAYSEICVRAPDIVRNHDQAKGDMTSHFMTSARWYVYKLMLKKSGPKAEWKGTVRERPKEHLVAELPEKATCDTPYDFTSAALKQALSDFDLWLLEARAVDGYSFVEIAEHIGEPAHNVSAWYRDALRRAREALGDER